MCIWMEGATRERDLLGAHVEDALAGECQSQLQQVPLAVLSDWYNRGRTETGTSLHPLLLVPRVCRSSYPLITTPLHPTYICMMVQKNTGPGLYSV